MCRATCIGRTEKQLGTREIEHIPMWAQKLLNEYDSENYLHLSKTEQNPKQAASSKSTKSSSNNEMPCGRQARLIHGSLDTNPCVLTYSKASVIDLEKPRSCKQKDFIVIKKIKNRN